MGLTGLTGLRGYNDLLLVLITRVFFILSLGPFVGLKKATWAIALQSRAITGQSWAIGA